jgi:hypothetical protein
MNKYKIKKQRQERGARVIAQAVKECFDELRAEECKRSIMIPIPEKFYCMEHKIYETPQDFNEEINRRNQASERIITAYEKGRKETTLEILKEVKKEIEGIGYWQPVYNDILVRIAFRHGVKVEI